MTTATTNTSVAPFIISGAESIFSGVMKGVAEAGPVVKGTPLGRTMTAIEVAHSAIFGGMNAAVTGDAGRALVSTAIGIGLGEALAAGAIYTAGAIGLSGAAVPIAVGVGVAGGSLLLSYLVDQALDYMEQNGPLAEQLLNDLGDAIGDAANQAMEAVLDALNNGMIALDELAQEFYDSLRDTLGNTLSELSETVGDIYDTVLNELNEMASDVSDAIDNRLNELEQYYDEAANSLPNNAEEALNRAAEYASKLVQELTDKTPAELGEKAEQALNESADLISPLVLDLDGDGVELTALSGSSAFFDLDEDGFAEQTGWVGSDDGLLVMDRDANGKIDDISELFGNATTDGFTVLEASDSNNDDVIDANDADFASLKVWRDLNGDGYANANELFTLSTLGIQSIALASTSANTWINGNHVTHIGSYTKTDNTTRQIVDAWFANSQSNTIYTGEYDIKLEALTLPGLNGSGEVADLTIAMSLDDTLMDMVRTLTHLPLEDMDQFLSSVENILFRWAGTEGVSPTSRGDYVDGRHLATLEKFAGQDFIQLSTGSGNPRWEAGSGLEIAWKDVVAAAAARLGVDGPLAALFPDIRFDALADEFVGTDLDASLAAIVANATATNLLDYWQAIIPVIQGVADGIGLSQDSYWEALQTAVTSTGLAWDIDSFMQYQAVSGGDGNDVLMGDAGADYMNGGLGNDTLRGGDGGDIYVFTRDSGHDVVDDDRTAAFSNADTVLFGPDILPTDLVLSRSGNDLIIAIAGTSDQLTIENQFSTNNLGHRFQEIESFKFQDGTIWTRQDIQDLLLQSTSGNDILIGFFSNDILEGGDGNDRLEGGDGGDTYIFNLGDGQDTIKDTQTSIFFEDADRIVFGAGIASSQLQFARGTNPNDLIITINGTADRITIEDMFATTYTRIERLEFNNGSYLTYSDIQARMLGGTSGNDTINGFDTADTLDGGLGNDTLMGDNGGDTYIFDAGYGQDLIADTSSNADFSADRVRFGAGINVADVHVSRPNPYDLLITIDGSTDQLRINNSFLSSSYAIERYEFSDGTVWTLANVRTMLLAGTSGDDAIMGFDTADILDGGAGNDTLQGSNGGDTYKFDIGYGQDVIYDFLSGSNFAADKVVFGPGINPADLIVTRSGNNLIFTVAGTTDKLTISSFFGSVYYEIEQFIFDDGTLWTNSYVKSLVAIINGTSSADSLVGFTTNDTLNGLGGNDTLSGGDGDDIMNGGDGDDLLNGSIGLDTFNGGDGSDTASFSYSSAAWTLNLVTGTAVSGTTTETLSSIENLVGGSGNDSLTGDAGANRLNGGTGADTLVGGDGADFLIGGDGVDNLSGGAGDDILDGGSGADIIDGGDGIDTASAETTAASATFNLTTGTSSGGDTITNVENLRGSTVADTLTGNGNANRIEGLAGADAINGAGGNDYLFGDGGNDTLTGGSGADVFAFRLSGGADTVTDFDVSEDLLDVTALAIDELSDMTFQTVGSNLLITFGTAGSVVLNNVSLANVDQDQFVFA